MFTRVASNKVEIVILAAGMGTRLGMPHPKGLTVLENGETIIGRQLRNIRATFGPKASITMVVGYQVEKMVEAFPDVKFVYNEAYDSTNTSKSLLRALVHSGKTGVLWMNGDVVFDDRLLDEFKKRIEEADLSLVSVNSDVVGEEEVKYTLDSADCIVELSKVVPNDIALGEAVGINYVSATDKDNLVLRLKQVEDQDYFERGIEMSIKKDNCKFLPFDISTLGYHATEVDFSEDLARANDALRNN